MIPVIRTLYIYVSKAVRIRGCFLKPKGVREKKSLANSAVGPVPNSAVGPVPNSAVGPVPNSAVGPVPNSAVGPVPNSTK